MDMESDTITAIATPHGVGAIAIVRVSGQKALDIASKMTKRDKNSFTPRYAYLMNIYDSKNRVIDKGIVIYFKAPYSFTGEDIVEFQIHGGIAVSKLVLNTALHYGARLARAGEFSKRAFLNGKVDLTEAEAITSIIEAKSEEAVYQLSKQLNGELKTLVSEIRDRLVHVLAHSEVVIDYAEEDLPEDIERDIYSQLQDISKSLSNLLESSKRRNRIFEGFKIAIVGRPNVGKSSLLNAILNDERAIVTDIAGTTRDRVEEYINIGTHLVKIVDTAGIRKSSDIVEQIGIDRSIEAIEEADIVVALFDGSEELQKDDLTLIEILKRYTSSKDILLVLNKRDRDRKLLFPETISHLPTIQISSKFREIAPLLEKLEEILNSLNTSSDGGIVLNSIRQVDEVEKTIEAIQSAFEPLKSGELELFSFYINEAINHITSISRPYQYSEMLDKMFSSFCLGK